MLLAAGCWTVISRRMALPSFVMTIPPIGSISIFNMAWGPRHMVQKKIVFVLGPPGVGKGTQCRKIASRYDFEHISAGELLRQERQIPNSQHGELIDSCIRDGKIVPAEITCKLLERQMDNSTKSKFLIDGFPRNQDNRDGWNKTLDDRVQLLDA
ncbi:hypothetical protein GEV33_007328 [Tenebrio molitor]|uniref:Adenylate kinase n=1 Tax=Tenebrio molitor TaxID=7067 RepID=A0A8J6HKW3_TENMO|nr:hypothetical protein GEV33_007328 [Tenebrio molitor]